MGWELSRPGMGRLTPLGSTTGSGARLPAHTLPHPLPSGVIVASHLLCLARGPDRPLLPLDECSLMADSLKAGGPV